MTSETSKEILETLLLKEATPERILEVMMKRADRYQQYYKDMKNRAKVYEKKYDDLLRSTGRLVTVQVEHMAQDAWVSYTWYKNNKYRWNGKCWHKTDDKGPHYQARHYHGKFTVDILLSEEDMPEVFTGECIGTISDKKLIAAKGHMINHGDKFELRKITNG